MDDLEIKAYGEAYYITTPYVILEVGYLREHGDGITAEVRATEPSTGRMHWAKVNLASTQARTTYSKALEKIGIDPSDTLERVVWNIVRIHRQAEPARPLVAAKPNTTTAWLIEHLIPLRETSVLYGDGGSGKSLMAMAIAIAGRTQRAIASSPLWRVASLGKVVYLDWESEYEDHAERLWGLSSLWGDGEAPDAILYQPMRRPLTENLAELQKLCHGADLVIVDSLGAACGPEPEGADAAIRTLTALRTLRGSTRLVIAHVTKQAADATGPARPFGSAFIWNLARSTIEMRRDATERRDDAMTVTFTHRKVNRAKRAAPRALKFSFDTDGYISINIDEPDDTQLSIPARILRELRAGPKSAPWLAESLDVSAKVIRNQLNALQKSTMVVRLNPEDQGRGKEGQWGLIDAKRTK